MSQRVSWADDESIQAPPVPISFLLDDDVLTRVLDNGLPADREGELIQRMLEGTDLEKAIPRFGGGGGGGGEGSAWESMVSDIKHLKSRCYWFRNGYLIDN